MILEMFFQMLLEIVKWDLKRWLIAQANKLFFCFKLRIFFKISNDLFKSLRVILYHHIPSRRIGCRLIRLPPHEILLV
jgi:hypothetical protein